MSVVESKRKIVRFVWQISTRGGVGSERGNDGRSCPAGSKPRRERYMAAENLQKTSKKRPKPAVAEPVISERGSPGLLRASFYHGAKIRNSAVLPLAGNLLGSAFPKPCYGGLRRKNISATATKFLEKFVRCKVRGCLEPARPHRKNFKRSRTNAEKMSVVK